MAQDKVPLLLLSPSIASWFGRRLRALGAVLLKVYPPLSIMVPKLRLDMDAEAYAVGTFISSFLYGLLFFCITLLSFTMRSLPGNPLNFSLAIGLSFWLMFFILHLIYPSILVKKIAAKESKDLLFALREIMIDVEGGVPLFNAMKNVSQADYGYVSREFGWAVSQIESGVAERDALRELAVRTESEYMKRSLWQIVNTLESGAGVAGSLASLVQSVENYIYRDIKNYSSTLNFLMLIYLLGAAVLPSLSVTALVILSVFSGLGVTFDLIVTLTLISAIFQIVLIGYMRSTRPELFGG